MNAEKVRPRPWAPVDEDKLLTIDEAAELLCMNESTVRRRVPRIKVGRAVRYSRKALLAWVEAQTQDPRGGAV